MPSLDEIRTVTIQAKTDGVTQSTDQVNKLAGAQDKLADSSNKATVVTDTQTRSHLSAQTALDRLRRQIDTNFASQQNMERGQTTLSRAEQQGLITGAQHVDLLGKLKDKYGELTPAETKLAEASAVVESRMIGMSASVGLVGEGLAILGPYGLAAAAGIGALVVVAVKLTESANRLGEWARALQDTSDTIGLTTTQLQAFDALAERVGVNAESNAASFERFTVNLGGLKNGTGSLFTELEKVNPALVSQLSVTKSNADAWNLLAKAYAQADAQQQALIAHAAFGKGGAAEGRVLTATNEAGGLGSLEDQNAANAFTKEQIALWAQLRQEIATASTEASHNIASIFTSEVLATEKRYLDVFNDFSKSAREFSASPSLTKLMDIIISPKSLVGQLFQETTLSAPARGSGPDTEPIGSTIPSPVNIASSVEVQVARQKELISVLGSAATAYDHLKLKMLELDVVQGNDNRLISDQQIARARAAATLDTQISVESRRLSLLGDMASVTEIVRQKDDELTKARMEGAKFTAQEIADMRTRNQLMAESSKLESKLVFDRQQLFKTATDQSVDATLRAAGIPPASDRAAAIRDYARMTDALKQMNDVGGTFASGFLTDISHGVAAVDALHNAMTRLADTLIDMAARQLVTSALGGLAGSFGLTAASGLMKSADGNVFDRGIVMPYAMGGIVNQPTIFPMANGAGLMGEAGPEAIMPLKRGSDGRLGVAGGGGSQTINVNMSVDVSGATGDRAIVALVQKSAQAAVKQAVATANAQSPARQLAYHQLGT